MRRVYGLTGGIASGKSTAARLFKAHGAEVIDADQVARDVVETGSDGWQAVVDRFGPGIVDDAGALNRERLGQIVFSDPEARRDLEAILHPRIAQQSGALLMEALQGDRLPVFYEAALLVESGRHHDFAGLVVVDAPAALQQARLMARNGLTEEDARARLAAQTDPETRRAAADHVLCNDGDLDALEAQVVALLQALRSPEGTS
jgi:dephospho-CoA kinase